MVQRVNEIRKVTMSGLTQRDFERLLEFRVTLRRFQRWSEDQAKAAGEEILQQLTRAHLDRLHELAAVLDEFATAHNEAYAKVSLKKYKPMAARNEDRNVSSGLL